ncbi:MAG: AbgT family transporter [Ignavibacteriaceae bacterium]|nr:AbgT family transporter [Ignavibacteriaceae bacterium]
MQNETGKNKRKILSVNFLDLIEKLGNKLPEPALLFVILSALTIIISAIGSFAGWKVQPVSPKVVMTEVVDETGNKKLTPKTNEEGHPLVELEAKGNPIEPRSLLTSEGVYWMLSSMLRNFTTLPALGLIFVAILGIGFAEKFGFFSALMRWVALITPRKLITPVIVLIGANASVASDAGYIILPPLAAALFYAMGRHPVAGLAAAFAGVAGGFGAGFFPTGGDGAIAGFAQDASHIIDPQYSVNILHNLYFKAASALLIMLAGWYVTDKIVEPRLKRQTTEDSLESSSVISNMKLEDKEKKALIFASTSNLIVVGIFLALILIPGMPLYGPGQQTLPDDRVLVRQPISIITEEEKTSVNKEEILSNEPLIIKEAPGKETLVEPPGNRWSHVIVPIIFLAFLVPGIVYGRMTGQLKTQKDFIDGIYNGVKSIVPVLVIAFFMAQFVNYFAYTKLDRMLAYAGGSLLVQASLPVIIMIPLFILLVILGDFAISGMLSKFGVLAPIFIPMFMLIGISPELTTAAYRIGDSVVNIITPLNSYLLIILAVLQKYKREAGIGSLASLMIPYSIVFSIAWTLLLVAWYLSGINLGPAAPLDYLPQ